MMLLTLFLVGVSVWHSYLVDQNLPVQSWYLFRGWWDLVLYPLICFAVESLNLNFIGHKDSFRWVFIGSCSNYEDKSDRRIVNHLHFAFKEKCFCNNANKNTKITEYLSMSRGRSSNIRKFNKMLKNHIYDKGFTLL